MNEAAKKLINSLRNNPHVKTHFSMSYFLTDHFGCGTVGCIAGHILMQAGNFRKHCDHYYFNGKLVLLHEIIEKASEIIDIPPSLGKHLFLPNAWVSDLNENNFMKHYEKLWNKHSNYRCDLDTIERMKEWAGQYPYEYNYGLIYSRIKSTIAANALEECLEVHPGYVDWRIIDK